MHEVKSFNWQSGGDCRGLDLSNQAQTLSKQQTPAICFDSKTETKLAVRRLTPTECERLQGFPDGYTDINPRGKNTPDGPRYKALGNSMAVPVMAWIGARINFIDKLP
jgi:DNA (cytosine-5)-methyltransferase 1